MPYFSPTRSTQSPTSTMSTKPSESTSTRASMSFSNASLIPTTSQSPTMDTANSSDSNIPIRLSKRRRASITQSITSDNPSIATSRPRRQAAIVSRSQVKSQSRSQPKSNRTSKSSSTTKAKARKIKAMEEEGDDEEEFKCPCSGGCETIGDCERGQKEAIGRDVGMRLVLRLLSSLLLCNHRFSCPVFNSICGLDERF